MVLISYGCVAFMHVFLHLLDCKWEMQFPWAKYFIFSLRLSLQSLLMSPFVSYRCDHCCLRGWPLFLKRCCSGDLEYFPYPLNPFSKPNFIVLILSAQDFNSNIIRCLAC